MEQRDTRGQASTCRFKCMHPDGCKEGAHFDQKEKKGPWHDQGATRWARYHSAKDNRQGSWDALCRSHMAEAQATSTASATQGSSCSGVVGAGGVAGEGAKGTGRSPRVAGRKRPRQASNQDAVVSQNLGRLAAANPRGWMHAQPIPPPPARRVQTHTDLEPGEVLEMTTRVAMEYTEGMPRPKADGTLSQGTGLWGGDIENMAEMGTLPFMALPRARNRALKRKPVEGWDEASMALALADHVVSGTLVFVVPELFNRKAMEADPQFRVLDEGTGKVAGVRMMCPACASNKHTASKGWHKQVRAVHTFGESGNLFPLGHRYVCFSPTCPAVQKAVRRKVEKAVGETRTGDAAGASSGAGASGVAKATSGTESVTGGAVRGAGMTGGAEETGGAVGASNGIGGADRTVRAKADSGALKDILAVLSKEEVAALLNGDLRLAKPRFLRRLLDGAASFLITDNRYMQYFPRSVQLCYGFDLFNKSGATHSLLRLVLSSSQSIAALTRDLEQVYNDEKVKKVEEYAHFAKEQEGTWPSYRTIGSGTVLSGPTDANTSTYITMKYEEIKGFTHDDLCSGPVATAPVVAGLVAAAQVGAAPVSAVPVAGVQVAPVAEAAEAAPVVASGLVAAAQMVAAPVAAAAAAAAAQVVAASVASAGDSDEGAASGLHQPGEGRDRRGKRRKENVFSTPPRKPTTPHELELASRCLAPASAAPDARSTNLYVAATALYNRAFFDMIPANNPEHSKNCLGMTSEKLLREHANSLTKQLNQQRLHVMQAPQSSGGAGSEPTPSTGAGSEEVAPSSAEGSAEASRQLLRELGVSVDDIGSVSGNACLRGLRKYRKDKAGLRNGLGTAHYQALVKKFVRDSQS